MSPRPTPAERGYDSRWRKRRASFLAEHPTCALCPSPSKVADHYPRSRKQLLSSGVPDPDLPSYLRPLCERCHNSQTATRQPGGWHASHAHRLRPADKAKHPGLID